MVYSGLKSKRTWPSRQTKSEALVHKDSPRSQGRGLLDIPGVYGHVVESSLQIHFGKDLGTMQLGREGLQRRNWIRVRAFN